MKAKRTLRVRVIADRNKPEDAMYFWIRDNRRPSTVMREWLRKYPRAYDIDVEVRDA